MRKYGKKSLVVALWAGVVAGAAAAEPRAVHLAPIEVSVDRLVTPTRQAGETVYTGSEVTRQGLDVQGTRAATSVYEALSIVPGIHVESADARGLAAEQGSVRVRGVRSMLGALTVEGVPNWGGNPIGPRDYLYDLENMRAVSVYKGATPADLGTGVGSRAGAIVLRPDWPRETFGLQFSQGLGAHDYSRTFGRIDSGRLPVLGTRLSGSYSYTDADKWRGPGELGPRHNATAALAQPLGPKADFKLRYNHNDLDQHFYRPLTWAELQDLDENYRKDYARNATGVPAEDIFYYGYNRGTFENDDLLAIFTLTPAEAFGLTLKPYYAKEDTKILQGVTAGGGRVQERNREIERTGGIAEVQAGGASLNGVLGYHFEQADLDIFTRNFVITPQGLAYRGLGVFATAGDTYLHSPYGKLSGSLGAFDGQAGLKYFRFEEASSEGFVAGPAPDFAPVRAPDLDRGSEVYEVWLPTLGAAYTLSERAQVYGSYGRSFIRPYSYLPLVNLYNQNRAAFQAQGIDLQELFDGYDLETSDTVDLGLRLSGGWFDLAPAVFFAKHRNLLTTVHDPRVSLNYQQNVGKATGYGVELEANAYVGDDLTLFVNPTYTVLTYDEDLGFAGSTLDTKGRQVVDTPRWLLKAGLSYRPGGFEVTPLVQTLGPRYADAEHRNRVGSHTVVDLRASYTWGRVLAAQRVKLGLEVTNLFDRRYVAVINAADDTRDGTATFHPGQPFAALVTLGVVL